MSLEGTVQSNIHSALAIFCAQEGVQLELLATYPNQQGDGARKYCGDLVGLLDNAKVLLLEVKEFDCAKKLLKVFKQEQHDSYLELERIGVPVAYAYNEKCPLPSFNDGPRGTLAAVKRSIPSELPDAKPNVSAHQTLLEWLEAKDSGDVAAVFGSILGAITAAELRNGVLVLVYAVAQHRLFELSSSDVLEIRKCLNHSKLKAAHARKLAEILGEESRVFEMFRDKGQPGGAGGAPTPPRNKPQRP